MHNLDASICCNRAIGRLSFAVALLLLVCALSISGFGILSFSSDAYAATPLSKHGQLRVKGTKVVDKKGKTVVLRGVNMSSITDEENLRYISRANLTMLRDKYGVNCIRIIMDIEGPNCYAYEWEPARPIGEVRAELHARMDKAVKLCKSLGLYVIVDWHTWFSGDPNVTKADAKAFFQTTSKRYKKYKHVIYEICNEPHGVSWKRVRKYANYIIPVIRKNAPNSIVVVGTPTWSACPNRVFEKGQGGMLRQKNILYAIHFYANDMSEQRVAEGMTTADLRNRTAKALKKKLPLLCTEFSFCKSASYDLSGFNTVQGKKWLDFFEKNGIGYSSYTFNSGAHLGTSAMVKADANPGNVTPAGITDEGSWILRYIKSHKKFR